MLSHRLLSFQSLRASSEIIRANVSQETTCRWFATGKLTDDERVAALESLGKSSPFTWVEKDGSGKSICKTFHFTDFSQAWAFMSRSALLAEKMDHHPEWFNVYSTVEVTLTTHDCGGVSQKDIDLAKAMDEYAHSLLPGA